MRFQNACKNNMYSNQLTVVIVEKIPMEEEPEVYTIPEVPKDQVEKEKGYYRCVYVMLHFKREVGVDSNDEHADVEDNPDEEDTDDVNLDDEREHHWRIVFEDNGGGVDDAKALLHAKRWDLYVNEKEKLVKGGYLVEVVGHVNKKVLQEVVNNHGVEEPSDHEDIVLPGFDLNIFDEHEEGVVREGSSEFPYLLMLIKILPGYWISQLNRMNWNVDKDNGKQFNKCNVRYRKIRRFSRNEFWKNIGCLVSAPTFGLGGLMLWEKKGDIKPIGNKRKRRSIWIKVDLYEVCISYTVHCLLFYFKTIHTPFNLHQISGISLTRGTKFGKYWPRGFELEADKAINECCMAKLLFYVFNTACNNISASFLKVGDESMSEIRFWTTTKGNLPHLSYIFRKTDQLGT